MRYMPFSFISLALILNSTLKEAANVISDQCSDDREKCSATNTNQPNSSDFYDEASNVIYEKIQKAIQKYKPCMIKGKPCKCYDDVIDHDLSPYEKNGVTEAMLDVASKFGTRYQIVSRRLFRDADCMFPSRCGGIEHFLLKLLPELDDTELIVNTRDWPQLPFSHSAKGPVFSFSKTSEYRDVMYPAWTFWAGGPAISLHPTGIGRWDLLRERIKSSAENYPWSEKKSIAFFRGSRTSDERDSLILLSRRRPDLVDAKYTKNQAWKSPKDTLNAEPAKEVSFEDHCAYKYLFNFRGVAASFRFKHLFLCKSLVFHVGNEWNEFFYFSLKPWVHYVPIKGNNPTEQEIESILRFFKKHDNLAKEIAERGFKFIWNNLRLDEVECYWESLLKRYKKLLKFTVKLDNSLIEIKSKV